jgi:hypothetical protein
MTQVTSQLFEQARAAAGDHLHIVPIVLGAGERLLENVGDPKLEPVEVVGSPAATHLTYRVVG